MARGGFEGKGETFGRLGGGVEGLSFLEGDLLLLLLSHIEGFNRFIVHISPQRLQQLPPVVDLILVSIRGIIR